jgi:hypothetical protein
MEKQLKHPAAKTHTRIFIAVLFIIVSKQNKPKYPSTEDGINNYGTFRQCSRRE